eukprot:scaffold128745_cov36-Tisochrysis_lutea.AAC.1
MDASECERVQNGATSIPGAGRPCNPTVPAYRLTGRAIVLAAKRLAQNGLGFVGNLGREEAELLAIAKLRRKASADRTARI